ncbi:MAG TPA: filamentous hemagglutinin family protein, partial [Steroidobacteraceae bacterium]
FGTQSLGPIDSGDTVGESSAPVAEVILPPVLRVGALSGDVNVDRDATLFPSAQADLQVLAAHDITIGGATQAVQIVVPDADPATMPTPLAPIPSGGSALLAPLVEIATPFQAAFPIQHGSAPLYQSVAGFDQNPVTLVAASGDITVPSTLGGSGVWSGKPVIVSAGQDVVDLNLVSQNLTAGDVTAVSAGRDVIYPQTRGGGGVIETNDNGVVVTGPGELQVTAGRNVDLGTSSGITTVGNQPNSALPSGGAGVSVQAGIGYAAPTYSTFVQQYIAGSAQFEPQLIAYVEQVTGQSGLTGSEAGQLFDALPAEEQRTFVEQLFFTLLRTYGEEAAKSGNNAAFAGAYAAIQHLFPGANPDLSQGETDPYGGGISLYFSRIYTEAGGGISLLAPGGQVDAGLALAPVSYGLNKSPQQLGIVVAQTGDMNSFSYSDFAVNQSRVFSADGGNILVWSTEGNIDAGRGSKTSLSAAAPVVNYDINGFPTVTYFPPTTGSGIQALADTPGVRPGAVDLFAPHGVVNANDAGIVAGNLTIAATAVLGTNNISVSGTEVGVPVAVTGLGTQALAGSTSAAGATNSAQSSMAQTSQQAEKEAPQATAALRWLDVFVLGFGEETCSANDLACLKRQKHSAQ